ncbi:MAG: lamin tail domain-containing protein [Chthoniobacteraceae bacterium]
MKKLLFPLALAAFGVASSHAALIITEVDPTGSSTSTYAADWFELTNTGTSAISLTGYKMDDNSNSFLSAVSMTGVSSIAAGQSVVFIEDSSASSDSALAAAFESAWFGSNVPAGFTIGFYGGSGVGLSSTTDAVNIFNASGVLQAGVQFGASTSNVTFDNWVAQITNSGSTDGTISTLSVVGVNGAFKDAGNEVGSPGAVPEPGTYGIILFGGAILLFRRRHLIS